MSEKEHPHPHPHPHAQVLRWVAEGEEIEGCYGNDEDWKAYSHSSVLVTIAAFADGWQYRIKPTPMCELAGIKFPVPMKEAPKHGATIFVADVNGAFSTDWLGLETHKTYLSSGLCHATGEAAKAHSEALRAVNLMAIEGAK